MCFEDQTTLTNFSEWLYGDFANGVRVHGLPCDKKENPKQYFLLGVLFLAEAVETIRHNH
jgi:hypothetical protein